MLVLDASATIAWAYSDEAGRPDQAIKHVLSSQAWVPSHWILEVVNTLLVGERRGRLTRVQWQKFLLEIAALPIHVDPETTIRSWGVIPALAIEYGLTSYDAAYLELAVRLDIPLATRDGDLARAARKAGVTIFE